MRAFCLVIHSRNLREFLEISSQNWRQVYQIFQLPPQRHEVGKTACVKQGPSGVTARSCCRISNFLRRVTRHFPQITKLANHCCKIRSKRKRQIVDLLLYLFRAGQQWPLGFFECKEKSRLIRYAHVAVPVNCRFPSSCDSVNSNWEQRDLCQQQSSQDRGVVMAKRHALQMLLIRYISSSSRNLRCSPRSSPSKDSYAYRGGPDKERRDGPPSGPVDMAGRPKRPALRDTLPPAHVIPHLREVILP